MKEHAFTRALKGDSILFLDGAMGTMLQASGMPAGVHPEKFCLENPQILRDIHLSYLNAGSNIITTCTFGANIFKLPAGLEVESFNREMALIARSAIKEASARNNGPFFVAGNVGPTGQFAQPLGDIPPMELIDAFARQIKGLVAGGADLIFIETQFDIAEARAAAIAARRVCDLPVMVSMTFEHGMSLTGSSPRIFAETMQNLNADVIGTNCSLGPDEMLPVVRELLEVCHTPVMAEPNAGMPMLKDNRTVFPLAPEPFADKTAQFGKLGVKILGGCCGTTPDHIAALRKTAGNIRCDGAPKPKSAGIVLTSRSEIIPIGSGKPLAIIGERINPTGKPELARELQQDIFTRALSLADEQLLAGASALDVNVGAPLVDETRVLPKLTSILVARQQAPLSLDSPSAAAIAAALPFYPASCLVNSISGEPGRLETLGPLCRDYGAPFIILPLTGAKVPASLTERIKIVEDLVERAGQMGISRRLMVVDILAMAVSTRSEAANICIQMIDWCNKQGLATTVGLSNISFGLPARDMLNATFLCMARGAGLSSCIANPGAPRLHEALDAMSAITGLDEHAEKFIARYAQWTGENRQIILIPGKASVENLHDAIIKGHREQLQQLVDNELTLGRSPFAIVNETLIPAITEVGALYESRKYFLPQLIRSAETMQAAFAILKPLLEKAGETTRKPVIIMATVEGDIHDIGKNIVCLLLGNHGFEVIDAGKDIPAEKIVECAERHGASIIGLSALMTTTMTRMKDTIELVRKRGLPIKVMVGGAAVTQAFADSIGADAYCEDAVAGVKAAKNLVGELNAPLD